MTVEEKAKAYDEAKARMSRAFNTNRCTIGFMNEIFPEFKDSDDERIRKGIIRNLQYLMDKSDGFVKEDLQEKIDWLERQDANKEYVFRPVAGTMIEKAVEQALGQGDVVLAFNGFYTPVKGKTSDEILIEYDNWIKKHDESTKINIEIPIGAYFAEYDSERKEVSY